MGWFGTVWNVIGLPAVTKIETKIVIERDGWIGGTESEYVALFFDGVMC